MNPSAPQTTPNAQMCEVIVTTIAGRGNGATSPFRHITEYWDRNGNKLAEVDPALEQHTGPGKLCLYDQLAEDTQMIQQRDRMIHEMSLEKNERNTRIDALENEKRALTQMCEIRDGFVTELRTEVRESEDRARRLEEALRWALGEHSDGFTNWEDWCIREDKPLDTRAPYYWRTELRERAGLAVSTSLPAATLAP